MNRINREDSSLWKMGVVYFNQNDPSIWVKKRKGRGRTVNMGHSVAFFITLWMMVIIVGALLIKLDIVKI